VFACVREKGLFPMSRLLAAGSVCVCVGERECVCVSECVRERQGASLDVTVANGGKCVCGGKKDMTCVCAVVNEELTCACLSRSRSLACCSLPFLSLCLSFALSLCVSLSLALSVSLFRSLSLCLSFARSLSVSLSLALSVSLFRSLSLCLSFALCLCAGGYKYAELSEEVTDVLLFATGSGIAPLKATIESGILKGKNVMCVAVCCSVLQCVADVAVRCFLWLALS